MNTYETALQVAVCKYEERIGTAFKPSPTFYSKIGLKRKRYGQIFRGEKPPTTEEIRAFAQFFGVPVTDFLKPPTPRAQVA